MVNELAVESPSDFKISRLSNSVLSYIPIFLANLIYTQRARGEYNYFTWPSSEVLAEYVHSNLKPGCNVLELSCGTGLPGLVAAKCSANVTLTDHDKVDQAYWR